MAERGSQSVVKRLRALPPELRTAGIAAACLAASLVLPWYEKSYVPNGAREFVKSNLSAFGVFSFVEAAVLLVALAVLYLIWARANRRAFHLPGGDGTVIAAAGGWALLLLVWRLFDKPDVADPGATVGIQWGVVAAMIAAGALMAAGLRVRAAHRPEPPNPIADEPEWTAPERREPRRDRPDRRPRDATAVTQAFRDRPDWQGEPPEAPGRRRRGDPPTEPLDRPDDEAPTDRLF